ncbi:Mpp10 protein-domain-containing protein [Sordaria brevicollis]|uniref:Mpp10 protein-domain-containing protein n=1 Tax=Sordaria brevicollis TaxID=83679 RepID=A0AAE0PL98_SORBR|nr:Mpp10 protein-domain-containing protein [Sordaria brevicollis]
MAGAGSITSSVTSTSQTITQDPSTHNSVMAAALTSSSSSTTTANKNPAVASFLSALAATDNVTNRHVFLQPSSTLPNASLLLAKETLDALAAQVADHQQAKLKEIAATIGAGKKRKREAGYDKNAVLKIRKLHVDEGFETEQIWQQAKKIIASAVKEAGDVLKELEENGIVGTGEEQEQEKTIEFGEDGFEVGSDEEDEEDDESGSGSEGEEDEDEEELEGEEGSEVDDDEEVEIDGEEVEFSDEDGEGEFDEEEGDEDEEEEDEEEEEDAPELVEDPNGLNDGFFSIDDFNRQTQLWEDADARADPNVDADSDDEELDWHADPFAVKPKSKKGKADKKKGEDKNDSDVDMGDESEDDEALEAAAAAHAKKLKGKKNVEQLEDDGDDLGLTDGVLGMDMDLTANDIYYKDFFAPPQQKKKTGNQRKGGYFPKKKLEEPDEADMERAENDVRRDLFDDFSDNEDDEDKLSDLDAGDPRSRRSAHERRQAKIAEEIRRLESELVAKRAWTLSGEASAQARPMNSLLEEDLEFEHVGKPVPVITEEVSETIEALIKRRILANEFDEVLRRRPDTLGNPNNARRGLVEIDDTKGKQSLAEIYEEEHVKKANPDEYVSASDEKLTRDETEIKNMWKDICAKLDALSSWHYKPKPAAPTISVVTDVATVAMEDAMPTTAQGVTGGESTLAPQEVYAPGKDSAEKGEVVAKSGLPIAKEEMSREEKARRRRREKERIRKAGGLDANKNISKGAQERKETMNQLKKGGVKVINRKGETVGLDGKKIAEQKGPTSSGAFKL